MESLLEKYQNQLSSFKEEVYKTKDQIGILKYLALSNKSITEIVLHRLKNKQTIINIEIIENQNKKENYLFIQFGTNDKHLDWNPSGLLIHLDSNNEVINFNQNFSRDSLRKLYGTIGFELPEPFNPFDIDSGFPPIFQTIPYSNWSDILSPSPGGSTRCSLDTILPTITYSGDPTSQDDTNRTVITDNRADDSGRY